jgi:hypothetical protein
MEFDDLSDGVGNEEDVDDMFETVVWQPVPERTKLSALLQQPSDRLVGMHDDGRCAEVDSPAPLWDNTSLDPLGLLRRAVYQRCPELYVSRTRPRRLRCKAGQYYQGDRS